MFAAKVYPIVSAGLIALLGVYQLLRGAFALAFLEVRSHRCRTNDGDEDLRWCLPMLER